VAGAAAAVVLLSGCASAQPFADAFSSIGDAIESAAPSEQGSSAQVRGKAAKVLESLPVKGRAPMTGYDRDAFGPAWSDVDDNGCGTRDDILARDLTSVVSSDGCVVTSGVLDPDPYTGTSIEYVRGASHVDIDHVVALGNAWVTGAFKWEPGKRLAFANDPGNLLAVQDSANRQKSDGDAATWLPSNKSYRCDYVARQIAVKAEYGLWVTKPEKEAMLRVLATCPGQKLPSLN